MRRLLEIAALGVIQGAAELLPVSSSAHVAALPRLLGWEIAGWDAARRKELEVALHAGAALALAPEFLRLLPDARTLALALGPPVVVGYALEEWIEERAGGLWLGLIAGAVALAAADSRARRSEADAASGVAGTSGAAGVSGPSGADGAGRATQREALALGLAQAAALVPGVSRTGATLAAARSLGRSRADASRLSFGVAGPVLVGATALKAWRARRAADPRLLVGVVTAFASARAALKLVGLERTERWWPYAAERLALAILVVRYGRDR